MATRDIRSLDIGMLRTFDALMRERSVSRAAARLFLSQPAVSASLNRLRATFGDPLFTRTSAGVVPTARAHALAPQVEQVLAGITAMLEGDGFDPARSERIFRVAGSDHGSRLLLPELSRRLIAGGSGARIHWVPVRTGAIGEQLDRGELDIGVIARIDPPRGMETHVLYEDRYVCAMRAGHPLAGRPVALDEFCTTPQVFLGYGSLTLDDVIDQALARQGRARLAQVAVPSLGQLVHHLLHRDHIAVIGRRVAVHYAGELATSPVPLELPGYRSLLCWSAHAANDAGIRWLREQVLEIMGGE
jgi:DNA-binding transcriptional LysR family regulator